ncbi:hypothetical protein IJI70_02435 [Candidatus Saccharibacteria bacterium]|nr:hypothetical protein [Candidatus Saccharibacteria bacterium]
MTRFLPRLRELSVDYVWVSPFYPSPWKDGGYDISDYKAVNPRFGTMEDFDAFVQEAERFGIKVLIDLVLNHTSIEHPWFKASEAGDPNYKDYYRWTKRDLGWKNFFNGESAFKFSEKREEFYFHLFHESQPDLNFDNPDVVREFEKIISFWTLKHGVAGFRLDVPQLIQETMIPSPPISRLTPISGFSRYYMNPKTLTLLNELFAGRDLYTIGEGGSPFKSTLLRLVQPNGPLSAMYNVLIRESVNHRGIVFPAKPSLSRLSRAINRWGRDERVGIILESHDHPRFTSYSGFSGEDIIRTLFKSRAKTIVLYQGQELGLLNPKLPEKFSEYEDRMFIMQVEKLVKKGFPIGEAMEKLKPTARENARVPLDLVEYRRQEKDPLSTLNRTKGLIRGWRNGMVDLEIIG